MLERNFQSNLIKELKSRFPGCVVLKNDSSYLQGVSDLLILYGKHWAMLEAKNEKGAKRQPNQSYYVEKFNKMSFGAFVYPENREEILNDLEYAFGT